jgi:hypothetical protein
MGSDAKSGMKHAARKAEGNRAFRVAARAGFAANGLVHVLIGAFILAVAFGGREETDQAGAFKAVAGAPAGSLALWALAIALLALGVYHLLDGILASAGDTARKWGRRVAEWGQAFVFMALGLIAASVALGARPDADESAEYASRGLLSIPGGPYVLGLIGIGFGIGGISFIVMGIRRSFENRMSVPSTPIGAMVKSLGVIGFIAKGLALMTLALLLVVAAVKVEPDATGGLDAAIDALLDLPYGALLVSAVGIGLFAYGVFCFFRTRSADL